MQARKLLLVRPPVKERKMLRGAFVAIVAKHSKLHRRTGIENVHVPGFHRVKHPVSLVFRNRQDNLDRLIGEHKHMRDVMRACMPRSLCAIDDRGAVNAELLRLMKQPFGDRMMTVAPILFGIESELVAVHVRLRQTTPGCRHEDDCSRDRRPLKAILVHDDRPDACCGAAKHAGTD